MIVYLLDFNPDLCIYCQKRPGEKVKIESMRHAFIIPEEIDYYMDCGHKECYEITNGMTTEDVNNHLAKMTGWDLR